MRKGNVFESKINKLIDYVNSIGGHAHKNNPERLQDGKYVSGEPYDYELFLKDYKACFDAKESHSKNWSFADKDIKQAENLKHCKNCDIDSFFLVYFYDEKKMIKFDVDIFIQALGEGRKHLKPIEGEDWEINKILKECVK